MGKMPPSLGKKAASVPNLQEYLPEQDYSMVSLV
jgi:hypothetical protein